MRKHPLLSGCKELKGGLSKHMVTVAKNTSGVKSGVTNFVD